MNNEEHKENLFDTFDNDSNNDNDIIEKINIINKDGSECGISRDIINEQIDQIKKRDDAINKLMILLLKLLFLYLLQIL